jgi:hypothetical protein
MTMRLKPVLLFCLALAAGPSLAQPPPAPSAKADVAPAEAPPKPAAPAPAPAPAPIFPSVQIDIEPGTDSGQFIASARVFDLSSRKILAGPQLTLAAGTPGSVEVDGPGGAFKVRIEAGVDATGTSAQWSYTITEQGIVIAESRGTVTLSRPRDAGY